MATVNGRYVRVYVKLVQMNQKTPKSIIPCVLSIFGFRNRGMLHSSLVKYDQPILVSSTNESRSKVRIGGNCASYPYLHVLWLHCHDSDLLMIRPVIFRARKASRMRKGKSP